MDLKTNTRVSEFTGYRPTCFVSLFSEWTNVRFGSGIDVGFKSGRLLEEFRIFDNDNSIGSLSIDPITILQDSISELKEHMNNFTLLLKKYVGIE